MAGKKKGNDDAGMSKTARASSLKKGGKQDGFVPAAPEHMDRFISLGGGSHAYFLDPRDGKTFRLEVGSARWYSFFTEVLTSNHGPRVEAEMVKKGYPVPVMEAAE